MDTSSGLMVASRWLNAVWPTSWAHTVMARIPSQPAASNPASGYSGKQRQPGHNGGAHAVAEGRVDPGAHALPRLASGERVDARQGAAGHRQEIAQERLGRGSPYRSR